MKDLSQIDQIFRGGMAEIRALERECAQFAPDADYFRDNRREVERAVDQICAAIAEKEHYST